MIVQTSKGLGTKNKRLPLFLGGPGSGNFGHAGRPGMVGGSTSKGAVTSGQGAAPKKAAQPDKREPTAREKKLIARLAGELAAKAAAAEPQITELVTSTVKQLGGKMAGLEFRLKRQSSIESKLVRDREESDYQLSFEEVAKGITDTIRYTALFENEGFAQNVLAVHKALEQQGWVEYDSKFRNYFVKGNVYIGYNNVFVHPRTGLRYELQFHTPDSLARKERGHVLYEKFRELPIGSPEREKIMEEQKHLWDGFVFPEGTDMLPGVRMGGK